jgi:hypothetical protein
MSDLRGAVNRVIEGEEEAIDPDQIRIEAPREPEVNPEVYRDVEGLLFRGFLTLPAEINGTLFVFKSINHHEFDMLRWLNGQTTASTDRFYNAFIAYGVFMVDGVSVLPNRQELLPDLIKEFAGYMPAVKGKIIRYLSEINRKASNAVTLTEAFSMEQTSRFRWAQVRGLDLMSPTCTGVHGTETLGLNYAQLVWRALNHYEDLRDTSEREWDNAKFIGSCFAGKEIRKLYSQDRDRRTKEREARLERKDKLLRQVIYGEKPDSAEQKDGQIKIVARTPEELAKQLQNDLTGQKDWHDRVVEAAEKRISDQIQERRQRAHELLAEKVRDEGEEERSAYTDLKQGGLTYEQVQARIRKSRQEEAQRMAQRMVYPELEDPKVAGFIEKYGPKPDATYQQGGSTGQDGRDPSAALPAGPPRPRGTPFRRS